MSPRILAELMDHIIDYLWVSVSDLRMCALVRKAWLPSSRPHLFESITFPDVRFANLLESPVNVFATHTRSVYLRLLLSEEADTAVSKIVSQLPSFLQSTSLVVGVFPPSPCNFSPLPRPAKLSLQHTKFSACSHFTRFLSSFTTLRRLELAWVSWKDAGQGIFPLLELSLESLSLQGYSEVLSWLLSDYVPVTRGLDLHIPNNASSTALDWRVPFNLATKSGNVELLGLGRLSGLRRFRLGHGIYFHPGNPSTCRIFRGIMDVVAIVYANNCLDALTFDVNILSTETWIPGSLPVLENILRHPAVAQIRDLRFIVQSQDSSSVEFPWKAFETLMCDEMRHRRFIYTQEV
ncbi:hypothetical protein B0H17DRAFT_1197659 [Mycena rosella]|uniref:Uncharacterized protein n=1 Tax=Mycena rosella TaxID=1033263 RepID=A0AAD7GJ80_MYCRO|nr:hypothetical protein B0H17DRAFT_1197659 [Mycena rosella]